VGATLNWAPQPAQKRTPAAFCRPQVLQVSGAGAGVRISCPQLVQKATSGETPAWQAGHERIAGGVWAAPLSAEPQCIQKAAPGFTAPLQRGQMVDALCICTAVPHSGQNFLPVTSFPQDVQVAIIDPPAICSRPKGRELTLFYISINAV